MHRIAVRIVGLLLIFAPLAAAGPGAGPVLAAGSCHGLLMHFDGQYTSGGWGASSYIVVRNPSYCTTSSTGANHISAWAMVESNNDSFQYAQIGYIKRWGLENTPKYFAEYNNDDGIHYFLRTFGTASLGAIDLYQAIYDTSSHTEAMVLDATWTILRTSFDPNGNWQGPWYPQWMGEVHDGGDEMPGTNSARASFSTVSYQKNYGGGFVTPTWEAPMQDQGCQQWYNYGAFDIWHC